MPDPGPFFPRPARGPLDPRGEIHLPIGYPDTLDTLKTFVEPEGCFSPGIASYGIYFWLYEPETGRFTAPMQDEVPVEYGLSPEGYLLPWSAWQAGELEVHSKVCQARRPSPEGEVYVVGVRLAVTNRGSQPRRACLIIALRSLGPAGWPVHELAASPEGDALLVEGHPAIVASRPATRAGVLPTDTIGEWAVRGELPANNQAQSKAGDCSGALRFDIRLEPGETWPLRLACPVLPGRRAVGHRWDGVNPWFQLDLNRPNPPAGGVLQPDPGPDYYRGLPVDDLFGAARRFWERQIGPARLRTPDPRWAQATTVFACHLAMAVNEGAPDLAVYNLNVFNRDCASMVNFMEKAGHPQYAVSAIEHMLAKPFSGRVQPESDNPGQILWLIGEHWKLSRDRPWLEQVYPAVQRLVALIRYYRTTPGPHWVGDDTLDFGDALSEGRRKELKPGACDGFHPEYTHAFDIAGLRAAASLAGELGRESNAQDWNALTDFLFRLYHQQFGGSLGREYGSYAVQWPCRLYPLEGSPAQASFRQVGARPTGEWRYFPLAFAHQGLLSGSREAGYGTVALHLDDPQMRGWYCFDEGGPSGSGGWGYLRTTWSCAMERPAWAPNSAVAMPDGWGLAELWLLMRDCLYFEDEGTLVLLAGADPAWLAAPQGIAVDGLPTHFGPFSMRLEPTTGGARLGLGNACAPPRGYRLRLPASLHAQARVDDQAITPLPNGDIPLAPGTRQVELVWKNDSQ
jgi:hypothetical protein